MSAMRAARWGLFVFGLGIILLLAVFVISYLLFASIGERLAEAENLSAPAPQPLSSILTSGGIKFVLLLVMGYVSSLIASKGLSLYAAAQETEKSDASDH